MTGLDGSSVRVSQYNSCRCACWRGSRRFGTPQLSLSGAQMTIEGWLRSRRTASIYSRVKRATYSSVNT